MCTITEPVAECVVDTVLVKKGTLFVPRALKVTIPETLSIAVLDVVAL